MFKKLLILVIAGTLGLVTGWFGGELYYNTFGPSYGQFGNEFEGFGEAAVGAGIGLIIFAAATYLLFIKKRNK